MAKILVIDDEKPIRDALTEIFEDEQHTVFQSEDGFQALAFLKNNEVDVIFCDIKMPKMDGIELLEKVISMGITIPFIMISAHGTIDTAVEATKKGAFDFIQKPPDLKRLLLTLRNATEKYGYIKENSKLKKQINKVNFILGDSKPIVEVKETIEKVAPTEGRVLIMGENGTGKELVARWIHEKSARNTGEWVEVNCAAIPSELIESELFGHEKGSFTSAYKKKLGKFELASGGSLFLDEIGDMSLSAQAKVLRALQENKITRVGGDKAIAVNVRILAATNKDLKKEIEQGKFREDLYHRLSVVIIKVPPLRDRASDVPILINHFLEEIAKEQGNPIKKMDPKSFELFKNMNWSGNIRELRNVTERLVIMSENQTISEKEIKKYVVEL